MKVYIDVLLIENFLVNIFLLYITSETMMIRPNISKMILPSTIATIYTLSIFLPKRYMLNSLVVKISICVIFVYIYFRVKDFRFVIKSSLIYIGYSMVLAGLCFFIDMEFNSKSPIEYNLIDFSYKYIMIAVMIIYMVAKRISYFIKDRKILKELIYKVQITGEGWTKEIKAFLDTGNELREPVTNLPVIIIEEQIIKTIIFDKEECFYIPYSLVDGSVGHMKGFRVKEIKIFYSDKDIKTREGIVCFCENKLSSTNEYNGLLSRGLI